MPGAGLQAIGGRLTTEQSAQLHDQNTDTGTTQDSFQIGGATGPRIANDGGGCVIQDKDGKKLVEVEEAGESKIYNANGDRCAWIDNQGNLELLDTSQLASESLSETDFATHAKWAVTGDFDDTGGNAAYTHSTGAGTLTQLAADMVISGVADAWYMLKYDISGATGDKAAEITTAFALAATALDLTDGVNKTVLFKSAAAPTDFVVSATSSAGDAFMDNMSLKQVTGGDLVANGDVQIGGEDGPKLIRENNEAVIEKNDSSKIPLSASGFKDALETLAGAVRLDASAIKNLASNVNIDHTGKLSRNSVTEFQVQARHVGTQDDLRVNGENIDISTALTCTTSNYLIAANGSDSGAAPAAVSTLYYAYVSNSLAAVPSVLRLSATAPTNGYLGASGAAHYRFVGAVYLDASLQMTEDQCVCGYGIDIFEKSLAAAITRSSGAAAYYDIHTFNKTVALESTVLLVLSRLYTSSTLAPVVMYAAITKNAAMVTCLRAYMHVVDQPEVTAFYFLDCPGAIEANDYVDRYYYGGSGTRTVGGAGTTSDGLEIIRITL